MSKLLLHSLLRGQWMMNVSGQESIYREVVTSILSGSSTPFAAGNLYKGMNVRVAGPSGVLAFDQDEDDENSELTPPENIEQDSVLILPVDGPVLKYDFCGAPGAMTLAELIKWGNETPEISRIVLIIDSPGGMVSGTRTLVNAIRNSKKQVVGFIQDGMACSAAYWIGAACHQLYTSLSTDVIGSVGVYVSICTECHEGTRDIYSSYSTEKNKSYRDALKGDDKLLIKELDDVAEVFISEVAEFRGDKLKSDDWKKGGTFKGSKAVELGLVDGIMTFDQVLDIKPSAESTQANQKQTYMKFSKICALLGLVALEASSEGVFLSEEQLNDLEAALPTVAEGESSSASASASSTIEDEQETEDNATELARAQELCRASGVEPKATVEGCHKAISAHVASLRKKPAAARSIAASKKDADSKTGTNVWDIAHNKEALESMSF